MTSSRKQDGFVVLEVIIAVTMFAMVGTALAVAINQIGSLSFELHRGRRLARILDSELRRNMSLPRLHEGKETKTRCCTKHAAHWKPRPYSRAFA